MVLLLSVLFVYFFKERQEDKLKASIGILPTVTYKASDLTLFQPLDSSLNFEAKFKTYVNKNYYYKWEVYKNGRKSKETTCKPITNGLVDKQTIKIDARFNYGKWGIYLDASCQKQAMVYYTLTYTAKDAEIKKKTFTVRYAINGAESVEKTADSCTTEGEKCSVVLPKITPKAGYKVVGWDLLSNGKSGWNYPAGTVVNLNRNVTLYAITTKIGSATTTKKTTTKKTTTTKKATQATKRFTVRFNKNTANSIGKSSLSCSTSSGSCNITLPSITAKSGYQVVGWNEQANGSGKNYAAGSSISINRNFTLYAITKEAPSIRMTRFSTHTWKVGTGGNLIVAVKPQGDTYTVTSSNNNVIVYRNGNLLAVGPGNATITVKSKSGAQDSMAFTVTGVNNARNPSRVKGGVASSYKVGNVQVYVEKGCPSGNINRIKKDLNEIPRKIVESAASVYLVKTKTFQALNNSKSAIGMSHLASIGSYIDVDCDSTYADIINHEIGHTLDYGYNFKSGKPKLSSRKELVSLYTSYKGTNKIRSYASSSKEEFFADTFAFYYRKNYAKSLKSTSLTKYQYPTALMGSYITEWNNLK